MKLNKTATPAFYRILPAEGVKADMRFTLTAHNVKTAKPFHFSCRLGLMQQAGDYT